MLIMWVVIVTATALRSASEVMLASNKRWALMHELRSELEPTFNELLAKMLPVDLILVEDLKRNACKT